MIRTVVFLGLIYAQALFCGENGIISLRSDEAESESDRLNLSGNILIEHYMGSITSDYASVPMSMTSADDRYFNKIKFQKNVILSMRDGQKFYCQYADINPGSLTAVFTGESDRDVVYHDYIEDENINVTLRSLNMNVKLVNNKGNYIINNIFAQNNVYIAYGNEFNAYADRAIYHNISARGGQKQTRGFNGLVFLLPLSKDSLCRLVHRDNHVINAKEIRYDSNKRLISCSDATGEIFLDNDVMNFNSGLLAWDIVRDKLIFSKATTLRQSMWGVLNNEGEIHVNRSEVTGEGFRHLLCLGKTSWVYLDAQEDSLHRIFCDGQIDIDNDNYIMMFEKSSESDKQVVYRDNFSEIEADSMVMTYSTTESGVVPEHVVVNGNIKMRNMKNFNYSKKEEPVMQYALADNAEYQPDQGYAILRASEGKRVLFLDKANSVQMSAEAVEIANLGSESGEIMRRMGNTRFTFNEEEFGQLKKHFKLS